MKNWRKRYQDAQANGYHLISDKDMRKALLKDNPFCNLQEVRFPEFTADIISINPDKKIIFGIEIKSDRDKLDRLEHQLRGYMRYCSFVFVYTTNTHLEDVKRILSQPEFEKVGILLYVKSKNGADRKLEKRAFGYEKVVKEIGVDWITKKHQLHQWLYLLEEIWGKNED